MLSIHNLAIFFQSFLPCLQAEAGKNRDTPMVTSLRYKRIITHFTLEDAFRGHLVQPTAHSRAVPKTGSACLEPSPADLRNTDSTAFRGIISQCSATLIVRNFALHLNCILEVA